MGERKYGILLPHFGKGASKQRIVKDAIQIEKYGFDSVWVRDHIVFHPHEFEDPDRTFVEPFVTLGAIAAVTDKITLGTASLIPYRHPIQSALALASLDLVAGPDRIIAGWGLGTYNHEFDAVGMKGWDRREVFPEQVRVMRALWSGSSNDFAGAFYNYEGIDIYPRPAAGSIPIWYCGSSYAAVRRSVEYCDGWLPGRMPRRDLRGRMERLRRLAGEAGKPLPTVGLVPSVSPGLTMEAATRSLDLQGLIGENNRKKYLPPESGEVTTLDDLDGAIIAGDTAKVVEEIVKVHNEGVDHVIFDMRLRFEDWDEVLGLAGEEILPLLRRL